MKRGLWDIKERAEGESDAAPGVVGWAQHPLDQWNCCASVDPTRASVALSGLSAVDTRSK